MLKYEQEREKMVMEIQRLQELSEAKVKELEALRKQDSEALAKMQAEIKKFEEEDKLKEAAISELQKVKENFEALKNQHKEALSKNRIEMDTQISKYDVSQKALIYYF